MAEKIPPLWHSMQYVKRNWHVIVSKAYVLYSPLNQELIVEFGGKELPDKVITSFQIS